MTSYLIARTEQHLGGGFNFFSFFFFDQLRANVYIPPIHICASDYTEFSVLLSVSTAFQDRTRYRFYLQRMKPHVGGLVFGWQSYGMQEALLHKYLLFPAALVFLTVAVREVVHVSGRCTGYN